MVVFIPISSVHASTSDLIITTKGKNKDIQNAIEQIVVLQLGLCS